MCRNIVNTAGFIFMKAYGTKVQIPEDTFKNVHKCALRFPLPNICPHQSSPSGPVTNHLIPLHNENDPSRPAGKGTDHL